MEKELLTQKMDQPSVSESDKNSDASDEDENNAEEIEKDDQLSSESPNNIKFAVHKNDSDGVEDNT